MQTPVVITGASRQLVREAQNLELFRQHILYLQELYKKQCIKLLERAVIGSSLNESLEIIDAAETKNGFAVEFQILGSNAD